MKFIYIFSLLISTYSSTILVNAQINGQGKFIRLESFNSVYVNPRHIDIWLPIDFSSEKKYAVIYMHDGQMLFDSTNTWNKQEWKVDEVMTTLLNDKKVNNTIIVGIWNDGEYRHADYYPEKTLDFLPDTLKQKIINNDLKGRPNSDEYLKFIVKELKPYIDSHFPTLPDKNNTFIAGSSMGGLISMYAICEYPQIFGGAACISTHWPGSFFNQPLIPESFLSYLRVHLPNPEGHKLYFDYGTETLDRYYEPWQKKADEIINAKGYNKTNWLTKAFPGADHSEKSWAKRLDIPFIFLIGQ